MTTQSNQRPQAAIVQELRAKLRTLHRTAVPEGDPQVLASTGVAALDALLSPGVFRPGMIMEWITARSGAGTAGLVLPLLRQQQQAGGVCVVIDDRCEFYPPAALRWGIDLERTVVIRPRSPRETIWTLEQTLRCPGVAATLARVGKLPDRAFRRLQLAAEQGAGVAVFWRSAEARHAPGWADLRWFVEPVPQGGVRVELLQCREGRPGGTVCLEINDETGAVRVVPPVVSAAHESHAARA